MDIAFIGVGLMGSGMAANLVKAGHNVRAFDLSKAALEHAVANGCFAASNVTEAVGNAEAVVTMLPAGKHVSATYHDEIFQAAHPNAVLIDCSTIDVATAQAVAAAAAERQLTMVDAPVSGGTGGAANATLTFMVGGSATGFAAVKPILEGMGKAVIHAGGPGMGQAAKICNNMMLGIHMIGTCEGFVLAQKLGLDTQTFFDIASKSSGQSFSMTSFCPVPGPVPAAPSNRGYAGGFSTALMLKDLKLAVGAAQSVDATVAMGSQAESLFQLFAGLGGGGLDLSAIIKLIDGSWVEGGAT